MTPEELAAQLRCPHGPLASEIAARMNTANAGLTLAAIDALGIVAGERILEIGPGNAAFAPRILALPGTRYLGVDLSPDMVAEAAALHRDAVADGRAAFLQGDAAALPVEDAGIDRVLAVNTLYFWDAPARVLAEAGRVLRDGGTMCLAFADAGFLRGVPFAAHGFHLRDVAEVRTLLADAGFVRIGHRPFVEQVQSNTGEQVERSSHLVVATRG